MEHRTGRGAQVLFFVFGFGLSWAGWTWLHVLAASPPTPAWWPLLFYSGTSIGVAALVAARAESLTALRALLARIFLPGTSFAAWFLALAVPIAWVAASAVLYAAAHGGVSGRVDLGAWWAVMTRPEGLVNLAYPISEEIAWRGFLLPRWTARLGSLRAALAVGMVWALWHVPFYWTRLVEQPLWFANFCFGVVCLSVVFALVVRLSGSVLPAILLHWHVNAIQDAVTRTFPELPPFGQLDGYLFTFSVVMVAIATLCAAWLVRLDRHGSVAAVGV